MSIRSQVEPMINYIFRKSTKDVKTMVTFGLHKTEINAWCRHEIELAEEGKPTTVM